MSLTGRYCLYVVLRPANVIATIKTHALIFFILTLCIFDHLQLPRTKTIDHNRFVLLEPQRRFAEELNGD